MQKEPPCIWCGQKGHTNENCPNKSESPILLRLMFRVGEKVTAQRKKDEQQNMMETVDGEIE